MSAEDYHEFDGNTSDVPLDESTQQQEAVKEARLTRLPNVVEDPQKWSEGQALLERKKDAATARAISAYALAGRPEVPELASERFRRRLAIITPLVERLIGPNGGSARQRLDEQIQKANQRNVEIAQSDAEYLAKRYDKTLPGHTSRWPRK